jgi:large subunit ribosomal protein L32e
MTEKKKLLEVRKTLKDKKPEFKQQNFGRKVRVSDRWKKPRGLQSKMRHNFKGYSRTVSSGWRSPVEVRGLDNKGYNAVIVSNVLELDKLSKGDAIVIGGTVGNKKRLAIVEKAEKLGIIVTNIKTDKFKEKMAKVKSDKEQEKIVKTEKKKKSIEDSLKKAEKKEKDKKKTTESVTLEDEADNEKAQKSEDKKAKDDVLIHKD